MTKLFIALGFLFFLEAHASIEYLPDQQSKATTQEVEKSRSCFQELETQGCRNPGEDPEQFRSCLKNVYGTLTTDFKKMMNELYGVK